VSFKFNLCFKDLDEDLAHSSIRFGIGRFTTEEEVDFTVRKCVTEAHRLREVFFYFLILNEL